MMQCDAVAGFKSSNPRAGAHDGAGGFVAEDARGRDGAVHDFLDIRWADAANGDFDEEFVGADARDRDGFDAHLVRAAVNGGPHGFGDREHAEVLLKKH
jgi:hypothetical protein